MQKNVNLRWQIGDGRLDELLKSPLAAAAVRIPMVAERSPKPNA
jgi:hypothetical protein